jgi:manganese-dependent inorganic pyrophosphatase
MLNTRFHSYPVVDGDGRFSGFISRFHLISHHRKKVILVDHSERSQTVNGIEQAEILEIIDHHRIGDIETGSPIFYRNEPVGSTATIVAGQFLERGIEPPEKIAGILCSAILSDTVKFKSPTSTKADIAAAERLAASQLRVPGVHRLPRLRSP